MRVPLLLIVLSVLYALPAAAQSADPAPARKVALPLKSSDEPRARSDASRVVAQVNGQLARRRESAARAAKLVQVVLGPGPERLLTRKKVGQGAVSEQVRVEIEEVGHLFDGTSYVILTARNQTTHPLSLGPLRLFTKEGEVQIDSMGGSVSVLPPGTQNRYVIAYETPRQVDAALTLVLQSEGDGHEMVRLAFNP